MDAEKTFIAYYRVSTQAQGRSGLGLEAQHEAVRRYVQQCGGTVLAEFQEIESGGKTDRPQLTAALERCRLTQATLLVAKLDRLTRDLHFLCRLRDAHVPFLAVDTPDANDLTIAMLVVVAEDERRKTSERTRAALQAAKARGVRLGNPLGARAFGERARAGGAEAVRAKATAFAERVGPVILPLYDAGMSLRAIAVRLNEEHIVAPRGGEWRACSVRRVVARLRPAEAPEIAPEDLATGADAPESRAPGSCTESAGDALGMDMAPEAPERELRLHEDVAGNEVEDEDAGGADDEVVGTVGAETLTAEPEPEPEPTAEVEPEEPETAKPEAENSTAAEPEEPKTAEPEAPETAKPEAENSTAAEPEEPKTAEPEAPETAEPETTAAEPAAEPEPTTVAEPEEPEFDEWDQFEMRFLAAGTQGRRMLEDVPDAKKTPELCRQAVSDCGLALVYVPRWLQTQDLCRVAILQDGMALGAVPKGFKTPEFCLEAVQQNGMALAYVPEGLRTREICTEAVRQSPSALHFVPERLKTKALCLMAVKQDGRALTNVPDGRKTPEICMAAVRQNPSALEIVPNRLLRPRMCEVAVKKQGSALRFVPDSFKDKELCRTAVKQDGMALEFVPNVLKWHENDPVFTLDDGTQIFPPKICRAAVKQDGRALKFVPNFVKTKEMCAMAVRQDGRALEFVPEALKTPALCRAALKYNGRALEFVPEALKTPEMCAMAVREDDRALEFVPEALKVTVQAALEASADAVPASR